SELRSSQASPTSGHHDLSVELNDHRESNSRPGPESRGDLPVIAEADIQSPMAPVTSHGEPPTSTARRQDPSVGLYRQPIRAGGTFREVRDLYPVTAERGVQRSVLPVSRDEERSEEERAPCDHDLSVGLDQHVAEVLVSLHEARGRLARLSEGSIGITEGVVASEGKPPLDRRPRCQDPPITPDADGLEFFAG